MGQEERISRCALCMDPVYERGLYYDDKVDGRVCWSCLYRVDRPCPDCGGRLQWSWTCQTYCTDGVWWACQGCDSALELACVEWLREDRVSPSACQWHYCYGLNPDNPRANENAIYRPEWIEEWCESKEIVL